MIGVCSLLSYDSLLSLCSDRWAGRIGLRRGVFPANFVEVV